LEGALKYKIEAIKKCEDFLSNSKDKKEASKSLKRGRKGNKFGIKQVKFESLGKEN
jgi:hypothetical protein